MSTHGPPVVMEAVLSGRKTGWFANRGMVLLNINLCLSLISSYATGYDGSMMSEYRMQDRTNPRIDENRRIAIT